MSKQEIFEALIGKRREVKQKEIEYATRRSIFAKLYAMSFPMENVHNKRMHDFRTHTNIQFNVLRPVCKFDYNYIAESNRSPRAREREQEREVHIISTNVIAL